MQALNVALYILVCLMHKWIYSTSDSYVQYKIYWQLGINISKVSSQY